jgi:hypothetical protein
MEVNTMQTEYILKAMDAALAAGKEILNVYNDPSLIRKSNATVIIPLLLNPSNISFGVNIPKQRKSTVTENRIIPGRILSRTNAVTIPINPKNTIIISNVSIVSGY